jgi:hypothetical protein
MTRNIAEAIPALSAEGGAIVTSAACSPMELAFARTEGRFFVDADGCGFVLRYRQWREHAERAIANLGVPKSLEDTGEFVSPTIPYHGFRG